MCMSQLTLRDMQELTKHFRPQQVAASRAHFNSVASKWLFSCLVLLSLTSLVLLRAVETPSVLRSDPFVRLNLAAIPRCQLVLVAVLLILN